ncbi:MAG TPA: NAD(P)-binding domain-containing protein, partial [Candidatus Elarobacter sp.]|nr:NAD(P)-binding domain-containing protein [Candidatus Elarobacter sp.]
MTVCVLGLGYIGLPTAAILALAGHDVIGYDVDPAVLEALRGGARHVKEEPVRRLVTDALKGGTFQLAERLPDHADAWLICVPTPNIDHRPDLSYVRAATDALAPRLRAHDLVILESTVPPGTMDRVVVTALRDAGVDPDTVAIAH